MQKMKLIIIFLLCICFVNCSKGSLSDLIDIADGVPRKTIDTTRLGVNSFANDSRFGSIKDQFLEVRDTLKLNYVRVLFEWNESVQPSPGDEPNFSFYDDIVSAIPQGVDALVVLTGVPSWMYDPANFLDGDGRKTFVKLWVEKVVKRYAHNPKIVGYQIWNEPDDPGNNDNIALDFVLKPGNYVDMLKMAFSSIKSIDSSKLVLNAATRSISQNDPDNLNYNKDMVALGVLDYIDIYAIHYYGTNFEIFVKDGKSKDFLNNLSKIIWVTESGKQGTNEQLAYGERVWPYLRDNVNGIDRIYIFQHTDARPPGEGFGLRTLDSQFPVTDLYVYLRDR